MALKLNIGLIFTLAVLFVHPITCAPQIKKFENSLIKNLNNDGSKLQGINPESKIGITSLEKVGRWIKINGKYSYIVGIDFQRVASDTSIDYIRSLNELIKKRVNFFRVWIMGVYMNPEDPEKNYIFPYVFENGRYNINRWNNAFWTRLKNIIEEARKRNIIVCISVFNILIPNFNKFITPFSAANNVNSVFSGDSDGDLYPDWYNLEYQEKGVYLKDKQKALIDKTIDETKKYPNVILEIQNENGYHATTVKQASAWQNYWAEYARSRFPGMILVHAHQGGGQQVDGISDYWDKRYVDILNFHFYTGDIDLISSLLHDAQEKNKIIMDNEGYPARNIDGSINSVQFEKAMRSNWGIFTSGGYGAIFMLSRHDDKIGDFEWNIIGERLKAQRDIIETLQFWQMSPVDANGIEYDSLVSDGPVDKWQVICNPGSEYLVFFVNSRMLKNVNKLPFFFLNNRMQRNVKIKLPFGTYKYEWYDPRDGDSLGEGTVSGSSTTNIPSPGISGWNENSGIVLTIKRDLN